MAIPEQQTRIEQDARLDDEDVWKEHLKELKEIILKFLAVAQCARADMQKKQHLKRTSCYSIRLRSDGLSAVGRLVRLRLKFKEQTEHEFFPKKKKV